MQRYGEFQYDLGDLVQLFWNSPVSTVRWRGWLLLRNPGTGVVHRHAVYRLDNGHWDAYFEEELLRAFQGRDSYVSD